MAIQIDHELKINAPASVVWDVITDTARYGEWNPFVEECHCELRPGGPINMKVRLGKATQKANEVIDEVHEGRGFSYRMKPPPLGALRSYRTHDIEPTGDNSCIYRSHFELDGWLSPLVGMLMKSKLQEGFDGMSHAIKDRAEELAKAS